MSIFLIISITIIFSFIIGYFLDKNRLKKKTEIKILLNELLNFTSYSQFYEDLILFCIFYDVKNGFYIDVGANDPDKISVTKAFYLRDWYGINIEPLPNKYELLLKKRKKDINLQIGAGNEEGNSYLIKRGDLSAILKTHKNINSNVIKIKIKTMANICKSYIPKDKKIEFCKIDVEGGERDVLLGCDFENYRPKVFCIESTKPGTGIPCYNLWEDILLNNNYSFVYQYKINRFYIDNKIEGLRENLIS